MRFNTAISSMMILATEMESAFAQGYGVTKEDYKKFLQILSPFAPHITEELWQMLREKKPAPYQAKGFGSGSINLSSWPKADESLIKDDEVKIVVQINGKVRAEIIISVDDGEEKIKNQVLADENIKKHIAGQTIKKVIYVKDRLINIVV